jgi:hypothetical protein
LSIVVFAGPSLPSAARRDVAGVEWRPPAEAGDILGMDLRPDLTICLIDGFFDHRPAVRHKEILLALSEGARVIGASSIGALRAAEMAPFGMEGVGRIHRAFADRRLTGDDEVALVHASEGQDWRPLSVPLVEVRATLCLLVRERRIAAREARRIRAAAREVHYIDRSWSSFAPRTLRSLLEAAHVPLKRADAEAALAAALTPPAQPPQPPQMVETSFLRALARSIPSRKPRPPFPVGP